MIKRIGIVAIVVMCLVMMMAPAVFATSEESYTYELTKENVTGIPELLPEGLYTIQISGEDDGYVIVFSTPEPVNITYSNIEENYFGFWEAVYLEASFDGQVYGAYLTVALLYIKDGDFTIVSVTDPDNSGHRIDGTITFTKFQEPEPFVEVVTDAVSSVVTWTGIFIASLFGMDGPLNELATMFVIGISITAVFLGIKIFRSMVWGY